MTLIPFFANYKRFLAGPQLNQFNHMLAMLAMMLFLFMTATTAHMNTSSAEANALYASCCKVAWTNVFTQRPQLRRFIPTPLRYF
jgi:hypothetical protein